MTQDGTRRAEGLLSGLKDGCHAKLVGINTGPNTQIQTLSPNLLIAPESTALQSIQLIVPSVGQTDRRRRYKPRAGARFKMKAAVKEAI